MLQSEVQTLSLLYLLREERSAKPDKSRIKFDDHVNDMFGSPLHMSPDSDAAREEARAVIDTILRGRISQSDGDVALLPDRTGADLAMVVSCRLGTHSDKIPDPGRGNGPFWAQPLATAVPFACGIVTGRTVAGGGNAADLRMIRLLSRTIQVGEVVETILDNLLRGDVFAAAFESLGVSPEDLDAVRSAACKAIAGPDEAVDASGPKLVIVPYGSGEDEYVQLTPCHSHAMLVAVRGRIRQRRLENQVVPTRSFVVGGSKPGNAGLLNSDVAGRNLLLEGFPPEGPDLDRLQRSLFTIRHRGSVMRNPSKAVMKVVAEFGNGKRDNMFTRHRYHSAIRAAAVEILSNVIGLSDLRDAGLVPDDVRATSEKELIRVGWHGLDDAHRASIRSSALRHFQKAAWDKDNLNDPNAVNPFTDSVKIILTDADTSP